jgi:hypothetical protein
VATCSPQPGFTATPCTGRGRGFPTRPDGASGVPGRRTLEALTGDPGTSTAGASRARSPTSNAGTSAKRYGTPWGAAASSALTGRRCPLSSRPALTAASQKRTGTGSAARGATRSCARGTGDDLAVRGHRARRCRCAGGRGRRHPRGPARGADQVRRLPQPRGGRRGLPLDRREPCPARMGARAPPGVDQPREALWQESSPRRDRRNLLPAADHSQRHGARDRTKPRGRPSHVDC